MLRSMVSVFVGVTLLLSAPVAHAKARRAAERGKPRVLSGEARVRGDQKIVDFGETDVTGSTKTPSVSDIAAVKRANDHDFVKLRMRWHPEMVASTSAID